MTCACATRAHFVNTTHWVVTQWRSNHSAFNGYRQTSSAYSEVRCLECGRRWRTKAAYVQRLRQATEEERVGTGPGC